MKEVKFRHRISSIPVRDRQLGVVLVTVLIIVGLVGITAYSAIRSSNVELQIATGAKKRSTSFNNAELVLSEAEQTVTSMSKIDLLKMISNSDTFINQADANALNQLIDWKDSKLPIVQTKHKSLGGDGNYLIQYLGLRPSLDESMNEVSAGKDVGYKAHYFMVSSRFEDANGRAEKEIKTVFSIEANALD